MYDSELDYAKKSVWLRDVPGALDKRRKGSSNGSVYVQGAMCKHSLDRVWSFAADIINVAKSTPLVFKYMFYEQEDLLLEMTELILKCVKPNLPCFCTMVWDDLWSVACPFHSNRKLLRPGTSY